MLNVSMPGGKGREMEIGLGRSPKGLGEDWEVIVGYLRQATEAARLELR